jgi:hypothetical protein
MALDYSPLLKVTSLSSLYYSYTPSTHLLLLGFTHSHIVTIFVSNSIRITRIISIVNSSDIPLMIGFHPTVSKLLSNTLLFP